ncbi:MAG: hypothetical protein MJ232_03050 [archaeon]|nr:hypothetical protein [archaeon]
MKVYFELPEDLNDTFNTMNYINSICEKLCFPLLYIRPVFAEGSISYELLFNFMSYDGNMLDIFYSFNESDLSIFRIFNIYAADFFDHVQFPFLCNKIVVLSLGAEALFINEEQTDACSFIEEYFSQFRLYKSRQLRYKNEHCDKFRIVEYYSFLVDILQKLYVL